MSSQLIKLIQHGIIPLLQIIFLSGILTLIIMDIVKIIKKEPLKNNHSYRKSIINKIILIVIIIIVPYLINFLIGIENTNFPNGISAYANSKQRFAVSFTSVYMVFIAIILMAKMIKNDTIISIKNIVIMLFMLIVPLVVYSITDTVASVYYCNNFTNSIHQNVYIANLAMLIATIIPIIGLIFITKYLFKNDIFRLVFMCLLFALMTASILLYMKHKNEEDNWYYDYTDGRSICNTNDTQ